MRPLRWAVQPKTRYLNLVVEISTSLEPYELLGVCQGLEQEARRVRAVRWGPRTLDVDVLLYGELQLTDPDLMIPAPTYVRTSLCSIPAR